MVRNRILVLGVGHAQADLVRICKEYGYEVYTCANSEAGPARALADGFRLVDISDLDGVAEYARGVSADLVYSVGSDIAMPTVCRVSELLGLPCFVPSETAVLCNTKHLMRERLGEDFPWNLGFQCLGSPEEFSPMDFPLMMKPADSQGQRGVRLVSSREEMERHFLESLGFSRCRRVVLEEYAEGPEIGVSMYVLDGEVAFLGAYDRMPWPHVPGLTLGRGAVTPSSMVSADPQPVRRLMEETVRRLGIRNGPAFSQVRYKGMEPKLLEISPRLDGGHLWRLWKLSTGVDLLRATVEHFSGKIPSREDFLPRGNVVQAIQESLCSPPLAPMDRKRFRVDGTDHVEWYYEHGEPVRSINGILEHVGCIFRRLSHSERLHYAFPYEVL